MRLEYGATALYPICRFDMGYDTEEDFANGALISAAPDLLKAVMLFIEQYDGPDQDRRRRPENIAARAAIAKATGR